jgi:hypothetical protein
MPGFLLHQGAVVLCMHGGQAQPTVPSPRVKVSGQPVTTQPAPYTVAGCPFPPPSGGPCVTAQWLTAATRVRSNGMPLLLQDSVAVCAPTGTGVQVLLTQLRVKAA